MSFESNNWKLFYFDFDSKLCPKNYFNLISNKNLSISQASAENSMISKTLFCNGLKFCGRQTEAVF